MTASQDTSVPNANRGPLLLKVQGTLVGLGALILCLRFYTRTFVTKALGWDDFFILLGYIGLTLGFAFLCLQVHYGFGRHAVYVSTPALVQVGKWTLANEIQITFTLTFVKLSACIFILRMLHTVHKAIHYITYALSTLLVLLAIASILTLSLQCFPLEHFYNPAVPGSCIPSEVPQRLFQTYSVIGTIVDFSYVILPATVLKSLNMKPRLKYGLIALLALAIFPGIASIVKIVLTDYAPADLTWDLVNVELWNCLESGFGIIIASLPSVRPLVARWTNSLSNYVSSHYSSTKDRHQNESYEEFVELGQHPGMPNHVEIRGGRPDSPSKEMNEFDDLSASRDIGVRRETAVTFKEFDTRTSSLS